MDLSIFHDQSLKAKERTKQLCAALLVGKLQMDELMNYAKDQPKHLPSCIEAIECATRKSTQLVDEHVLNFVTQTLGNKKPKVKWESARVIGNIAGKFPNMLGPASKQLVATCSHESTVVRWATAYALGEIIKLKTDLNQTLVPMVKKICLDEPDEGVLKKFRKSLQKV